MLIPIGDRQIYTYAKKKQTRKIIGLVSFFSSAVKKFFISHFLISRKLLYFAVK